MNVVKPYPKPYFLSQKYHFTGDLLHLMLETQKIYKKDTEYSLIFFENGSDQKVEKHINHKIRRIVDFTESENLVENAQLRMARLVGRSMNEKKPTPTERDELKKIIQIGLTPEEKEAGSLVYRYIYGLRYVKNSFFSGFVII